MHYEVNSVLWIVRIEDGGKDSHWVFINIQFCYTLYYIELSRYSIDIEQFLIFTKI